MNRNDFDIVSSVEANTALTVPSSIATLSSSDVIETADLAATQPQDNENNTIVENIKVTTLFFWGLNYSFFFSGQIKFTTTIKIETKFENNQK